MLQRTILLGLILWLSLPLLSAQKVAEDNPPIEITLEKLSELKPIADLTTQDARVWLEGWVRCDTGVREVRVFQAKAMLEEQGRLGTKFQLMVPLQPGKNVISVIAVDNNGTEKPLTVTIVRLEAKITPPDGQTPSATSVTPTTENIPDDIWQACWNESAGYFDFTPDVWVNLPTDKQFAYAQVYQAWYATKNDLPIEKMVSNIVMRLIPPGKFWMGSPDGEIGRDNDEMRHKVLITPAFYIGKTEVTQAQWKAIKEYPSLDSPCFKNAGSNAPMERVSWEDCQTFCIKTRTQLPTEAQWEYACRAGVTAVFNLGNDITPNEVNYDGTHPYHNGSKGLSRQTTVAVGSLPNQNAWGCYDFHGNVWEWCQDKYADYRNEETMNPNNQATGSRRVGRGGCWDYYAVYCRAAVRNRGHPSHRINRMGLRCCAPILNHPKIK